MQQSEVRKKLDFAINMLFKNDSFLLENRASERAVTHKLAEYLQDLFNEYNVDCEYNRQGLQAKELDKISQCNNHPTDKVLPDILIHHRGTDKNNLIIIEIKTNNTSNECDIKKLELFTSKKGKYRYELGFFIGFDNTNTPEIREFQDGKEVKIQTN